jgi:hypothetical protein
VKKTVVSDGLDADAANAGDRPPGAAVPPAGLGSLAFRGVGVVAECASGLGGAGPRFSLSCSMIIIMAEEEDKDDGDRPGREDRDPPPP